MMPTILVTGRHGQLGFELMRALAPLGTVIGISRREVDLCDAGALRAYVRQLRPDIIVNAAAYTNVNGAESDRETAAIVNEQVPALLARELQQYGGKLMVHYSTDYVFDGSATQPYPEDAATAPMNVYGATKLAGEQALAETEAPHIILRTEWVYATRGKNFLLTILRLAREGKPLRIIADQTGAPTWARMLAEATSAIVCRAWPQPAATALTGVYHLTAAGQISWHGFAQAILECARETLERLGQPGDWCTSALARLTPISASEYPTPARRPAFSVLSNHKAEKIFGIRLPEWRAQLQMALEDFSLQ